MKTPWAVLPPFTHALAPRAPWAKWWSRWRAWGRAWRAGRSNAAAIQQLAWHDARVLDDIGAPPQWRAQVQAQRESRERWQIGKLDVGSLGPGR
ncbi:hypothetical protein M8A51_17935 [Schlegelella sp. S2-27]|uniref:DUF1127 domain-containing protein n=1 Tax=Caldimonas mangrovi TaxID=2944811 RepID=A0ABT0YRN8_9BURK|nr:hypothetical protein [Caldimonas mangrovi]MCM5681412.1 hypothetical protein [Caldimonas mangrovi]